MVGYVEIGNVISVKRKAYSERLKATLNLKLNLALEPKSFTP
ncbi:Hypothetical protein I595_1192 [Croceitalea dokdonensis DOKDO 023]|uniref:Uncharacterized protein n=1 Tax=Croceitalea dokdonensis DOKDO 023 TaxID=1300341 RepID=A0A0P7ALJ1_9FLAO|nr:Hypothetical protein I595_1192 [Croceitalea dokdonensis DOKDO 023]